MTCRLGAPYRSKFIARAVGLHRSRILSLIESGELEGAIDIRTPESCRSTIRVPRQAVIEFLESRKVVATSGKRARKVIRPTSYPRPADAFMALFAILSARVAVTSPL